MHKILLIDDITVNDTKYVNFFYKIPENHRMIYEILYSGYLDNNSLNFVKINKRVADYYMEKVTPDKIKYYKAHINYIEFNIFYRYYKILQPVIKKIIEVNNLYEKYPEYLI